MADFSWAEDDMFIDTRFPLALSLGATVTHEWQTLIGRVDSGRETRNPRWNTPLRRYTLRTARTLADMQTLRQFYIVMRGPQRSFRLKDFQEYTSSGYSGENATPDAITATDQNIGTGDGVTTAFQLRKQYTVASETINRDIVKPVDGTVVIALDGVAQEGSPTPFTVDHTTGIVTFATPPGLGVDITAGFEFDVHVRFESDLLSASFVTTYELEAGDVTLVELRGA